MISEPPSSFRADITTSEPFFQTHASPGAHDYALASLAICDGIAARDFDKRERLALDLIRKQSFGAGRTEAFIPELRFFAVAMRVSKGNVSAIVRGLMRKRVIEEEPQGFYGFRLPMDQWLVPLRSEEIEVINQLELLERPPSLPSALRDTFVGQCGSQAGPIMTAGTDKSRDRAHLAKSPARADTQSPVPDSGTGEVFPFRERAASLGEIGPPKAIPESGTAHALQCYEAPSEHGCNVTRVPESGTGPKMQHCRSASSKKKSGPLSEEQQALLDALGSAGAFGSSNESKGCWFGMVTQRPGVVSELLGELKYARVTREIRNPGAWMMDKWKRWGKPTR